MRGDRHMATVRSHNKITTTKPRASKTPTNRQRAAKQHAIHNRGQKERDMDDVRDESASGIVEQPVSDQADGATGTTEPAAETPAEETKPAE